MEVKTKIFADNGDTIIRKPEEGEPSIFCFDFNFLPRIGDGVIIQDGNAKGEYIVAEHIVHEVIKDKGCPIIILNKKSFETETRVAIDN
jgi:hypothetical protein